MVAARWAALLLIIGIALSLAQLVWLVAADRPSAAPVAGGLTVVAQRPASLETVIPLDLFGRAERSVGEEIADAPETTLDLTLRGLFSTRDRDASWAIIAQSQGRERHYRIGDSVAGAVLHEILADRVVIEHGGRFETLRLPREPTSAAAPRPVIRAPAQPRGSTPTPQDDGEDEDGNEGAGIGSGSDGGRQAQVVLSGVARNQAVELRQMLDSNPAELANVATIRPVMRDGRLQGYNLQPRQFQELFRNAGLHADDLVVAVNGVAVTDTTQMTSMAGQLGSRGSLSLTVERNGARQDITIGLN